MHVFIGWLAALCLFWAVLSFVPPAFSDDGEGTRFWGWVYAVGAIGFGIAYFFPQ
ncbi:hypothetical protein IZ6_15680 [Terrihabitans soli]|uniref:Uncharacterized protein n=1 Tax=Terrihabitans soli TaxID=708113 RepID=A0A6S6QHY8_9HYPH|nr:hypothetical protein [Terrihabitans soli]BCJ90833.1 hypothetical protein IZ6_15680 [Terrihabitans soli]